MTQVLKEVVDKIQSIGDWLDSIDNVEEKNHAGFNMIDKLRWPMVRGNAILMARLLLKYKKQIESNNYDYSVLMSVPQKKEINYAVIRKSDDRISIVTAGRIENFSEYLNHVKSHGFRFNGMDKSWYLPKGQWNALDTNNFDGGLISLGLEVVYEFEKEVFQAPKKQIKTVEDAFEAVARGSNVVVASQRPDSKFEIRFAFNHKLVELFKNNGGKLSGITEYNKVTKARETYDVLLVVEAIEKIKEMGIEVYKFGIDEAYEAFMKRQEELKEMIPEVKSKIASGFVLFPYQNDFIKRVIGANGNHILGDEVGLGKTIQALSYIAGFEKRALIICPKTIRRNWIIEAKKFFPSYFNDLNSFEITSNTKNPSFEGARLVSVNYESLGKHLDEIKNAGFDMLVLDESHKIKSDKTLNYKNISSIAPMFKHKLLLSGTAVKNKKEELYNQIVLVEPNLFSSREELKRMTIGAVWNRIAPYYISRRKVDVLKDLPEKMTQIIELESSNCPDMDANVPMTLETISRLKAEIAVAKVDSTVAFIKETLASGDSSIICFSDSKEATIAIKEALGEEAVLHHGTMSDDARESVKSDWQSGKLKARVFCTTRQSLAVGATLTRADVVIFNDLPWTSADVIQAEGRAHRIGSKKTVNVYWLVAAFNNFDTRVAKLIKRKYDLCKKMNEGKQLTKEEMEWMNSSVTMNEILKEMRAS